MCAFDLQDTEKRNSFRSKLYAEKLMVVGCGDKSIRFRPHLIITQEGVQMILDILRKAAKEL